MRTGALGVLVLVLISMVRILGWTDDADVPVIRRCCCRSWDRFMGTGMQLVMERYVWGGITLGDGGY